MDSKISNMTNSQDGDWWLEVITDEPFLYEFGPFSSPEEAAESIDRYASDLASEGWRVVRQKVLQQDHLFGHDVYQAREISTKSNK